MVRRAFTLLALAGSALGLGGCVVPPGGPYAMGPGSAIPGVQRAGEPGRRVALLLPLTGTNAQLGQVLLRAAQLSLDQPGAPPYDTRDTGSTPEGAAQAARAALDGGDGLIVGPLTMGETAAVAPVARAAGVPVLAFTSDVTVAQPGVWPLGITPAQQVRRLVLAVQGEGKSRLAAVLPQNAFGDALGTGLNESAAALSLPPPRVQRYGSGFAALNKALGDVSDYSSRRGDIEARQRAARASNDADGRRQAAEIGQQPPSPAPFDALLLGAVGDQLGQAAPLLAYYDIPPDQVRILGPAPWARDARNNPALAGAWYAAPDPATRAPFEQQYAAKYGGPPRDLASLAYDAAGIARAAASTAGFSVSGLVRPEGFNGADGLLALGPDGQVRRGLAIFEIDRGGSHIVQPAPQTLAAPGA